MVLKILFCFWMSTTVLGLKLRNPSYCRVLLFERQNVFLVWWLDLAWWWAAVLGVGEPAPIHGPQFLSRECSSVGSAQAAVPSEKPTALVLSSVDCSCSTVVYYKNSGAFRGTSPPSLTLGFAELFLKLILLWKWLEADLFSMRERMVSSHRHLKDPCYQIHTKCIQYWMYATW